MTKRSDTVHTTGIQSSESGDIGARSAAVMDRPSTTAGALFVPVQSATARVTVIKEHPDDMNGVELQGGPLSPLEEQIRRDYGLSSVLAGRARA